MDTSNRASALESDFRKTCRYINLEPPHDSANACEWLERVGLKFCAHFGTDNAVDIAGEVYMAQFSPKAQKRLLTHRGIDYHKLDVLLG